MKYAVINELNGRTIAHGLTKMEAIDIISDYDIFDFYDYKDTLKRQCEGYDIPKLPLQILDESEHAVFDVIL